MIDEKELKIILEKYKEDFNITWEMENYKWNAIKHFKPKWQEITNNFDKETFAEKLKDALSETYNLLSSAYSYPRQRILHLAKEAPEKVYSMFVNLYNEDTNVYERISEFKANSQKLIDEHPYTTTNKSSRDAFQTENAITVYLWLRYPDKYYIYKYREIYNVVHRISDPKLLNLHRTLDNVKVCMKMYEEMRSVILKDKDLCKMANNKFRENGYKDKYFITLTLDVGFYISRYYEEAEVFTDAKYVKAVNDILGKDTEIPPKKPTISNQYVRDLAVAAQAIKNANYLCEYKESHKYFNRKTNRKNYTEPHHLIPLCFQAEFNKSLDVVDNVVSLCSDCHNWLHYGKDIDAILKLLYNKRKDWLYSMGIKSYEDLKKFY